jgi:hypothetical protein
METIAVNEWKSTRRALPGDDRRTIRITTAHGIGGGAWFAGWMFTIGYAGLAGWKIFFALVVWPLYLGLALR